MNFARGEIGNLISINLLSLSEDIELDGERMEQTVEQLRAFSPEGQVFVEANYVRFSTGQRFLDYLAETKSPLDRNDVEP